MITKKSMKVSAAKPVAKAAAATAETPADARSDKRGKDEARDLAEAEYRKGMRAVKRGETEAAMPLFSRALEFDPAAHKARQALLSVLVGGRCDVMACNGTGRNSELRTACDNCHGTGRTPGILRDLMRREPVTEVEVTDREPWSSEMESTDDGYSW